MRKILIVEDEEVLRTTYEIILSTEPYIVQAAANGLEALELCKDTDYDLILLDLMMPQLDGVGFLKAFKKPAMTRIVILSNLSSGDLLTEALRCGASSSAVKADLSPRQLIALVRYQLEAY